MKELEELGSQYISEGVFYNADPTIQIIHYLSLIKEYEKKCAILGFSRLDKLLINTDKSSKINIDFFKFAKTLSNDILDCIKRGDKLIAIPLGIRIGNEKSGHANMLIFRPNENTIERFEPHGWMFGIDFTTDMNINNTLKEMFEVKMKPYLKKYTPKYIPPNNICPLQDNSKFSQYKLGFQDLEGQIKGLEKEGGGFCGMWSNFLLELMFLNQELTTKEVIQKALDISKEDPQYLKNVIRGYVIKVEKTLDKVIKTINANGGFTFEEAGKITYKELEKYIIHYLEILGGKNSHIETIKAYNKNEEDIKKLRMKHFNLYKKIEVYEAEELKTLLKKVFKYTDKYDELRDKKYTKIIPLIINKVDKNNKKENEIYEYIKKLEKNK